MAALKWMVYGCSPSLETLWDEALNLGRVPATEAASPRWKRVSVSVCQPGYVSVVRTL
ncbi:hypothetical protein XBLMG947_1312 [Xanthomonas bromi]|uniref:Uncharacterized protein n=1 Tax=Xanthomonas bromi TaxID=56449 RepID=A0A1C3NJE5_9XANT|nr:hypothetical protein XBLMG947_1312 [Xanthomonas bromi]